MKYTSLLAILCFACFIWTSHGQDKPGLQVKWPVFHEVKASRGVNFVNHASRTTRKYLPEAMTGGVAMFDYDGDGWLDLFFLNGAQLDDPMQSGKAPDKSDPRYWNRLYRNNGDGSFTDRTERAGLRGDSYGMGVAVGDYDNDGHPDLFVTGVGHNSFYRNNGDGTFSDLTRQAGLLGSGWSTGAAFLDFDRDGKLDLVVARYLTWNFSLDIWCGERRPGFRSYCHPDKFSPATHLLYRNNGDGTFTDASVKSKIALSPGKGLGVVLDDFDRDGWPDIAIANDSFPQQLFRNRQDGTFEELGLSSGFAYDADGRTFAGMGIDSADFDRDGWPDLFVDALANQNYALYRNEKGIFNYVSASLGVSAITALHSGWGAKFVDVDNDGWKDLFVAQGHVMDNISLTQSWIKYLEPLLLMRNVRGKFDDVSSRGGEALSIRRAARGMAFGDLDNDGSLDVAINCNDGTALVLKNQGGTGNNWILVDTQGTVSNRDGVGARVSIVSGSATKQYSYVSGSGSYLSASDKRVHFGIGSADSIALMTIEWPSGIVQRIENIKANQIVKVREPVK